MVLSAACFLAVQTGSVPTNAWADESCSGPNTNHTILNGRLWAGTGCEDDTTRIREASGVWGGPVRERKEEVLTDQPLVTLSYLEANTVADRVLILITHGADGDVQLD